MDTQNCSKCHIIVHGQNTPATLNHSAQCRARITEANAGTEKGRTRFNRLAGNENRHLAEHARQQAEDDTAQAQGGMSRGSSGSNQAPETVPPRLDFAVRPY